MKNQESCSTLPRTLQTVQTNTYHIGKDRKQTEIAAMKNKNIFQSMYCAFEGMKAAWKEERNFREYTAIYAAFFLMNLFLGASVMEILIGFSLVCGVFSAEYLNTALERLLDTRFPEISPDIKFIKDTAAAGVFVLSIAFFLSQGLILLPKLVEAVS